MNVSPYAGQHRNPSDPDAALPRTAAYGAITPYDVPLRPHGRLMVRYPDKMEDATRPKRPAVWPIIPLTFLFLIPGIIVTARRSGRGSRDGYGVAPYWITLAGTFVASWLLWAVIIDVGLPMLIAK